MNADGTGFARLTNAPGRDYGAAWKPDGSTLAFATTRYGADEIVLMNPAGGGVTRIGGLYGFAPTWSPDGTRLAFVQDDCFDWCSPSYEDLRCDRGWRQWPRSRLRRPAGVEAASMSGDTPGGRGRRGLGAVRSSRQGGAPCRPVGFWLGFVLDGSL